MPIRRRAVAALALVVLGVGVAIWLWAGRGPDAGSIERHADWPSALGDGLATAPKRIVGRFDDVGLISGGAYVSGDDGDLVASTIDGDPVWRYSREDARITNFNVRATHVAVLWDDDVVTGIDAAEGDPSWAFRLPDESDPLGPS